MLVFSIMNIRPVYRHATSEEKIVIMIMILIMKMVLIKQ